jgi:hypothetical protein
MPGPTATAGVVGVPCSLATNRTTATAVRNARVGLLPRSKPPEVRPCPRGDAVFIERGAATRHECVYFSTTSFPFIISIPQAKVNSPSFSGTKATAVSFFNARSCFTFRSGITT